MQMDDVPADAWFLQKGTYFSMGALRLRMCGFTWKGHAICRRNDHAQIRFDATDAKQHGELSDEVGGCDNEAVGCSDNADAVARRVNWLILPPGRRLNIRAPSVDLGRA